MSIVSKSGKLLALSALCAAAVGAQASVLTGGNNTFGTADSSFFDRTINIVGAGTVKDVNITIDFAKCDDPALQVGGTCPAGGFSFNREIEFQLIKGATVVNLVVQDTYSGQTPGARVVVTFDDEAASAVGGATLQNGSFRPVGLLSAFDGASAAGAWTLRIRDTVFADPLSFFSATLNVTVPEPGTFGLAGLALLGLGAAARRRRA